MDNQKLIWRPKQKEAVDLAVELFESGYKNVLIDASVGFGKSVVNYYIAKHFDNALYTTPQISLLNQIENDSMLDITVIKGRANYPCVVEPNKNASNAICVRDKSFICHEDCPYHIAKSRALDAKISAMSFAYLIYDRFVPDNYSFGNRELLIVDEGDDLESWAVDFGSFKFKVNEDINSIKDVMEWAKSKLRYVYDSINDMNNKKLKDDDIKKLDKLRKYAMKLDTFLSKVESNKRNWVYRVYEDGKNKFLEVKPVMVGEVLDDLVWSRGKYRLISSATIIDRKMFCRVSGLKLDETYMIKVPSIFPVENRPINYIPVARMTVNNRMNGYGKMVNAIVKIAEYHKGKRGMVESHSYKIAEEIYNRLLGRGIKVEGHNSSNRNSQFSRWLNKEFDVFVSVGFKRGIDLKYDLCRWLVICKVPYSDTTDIRVNELLNKRKSWNWYRYNCIQNLVQSTGRIVRAEDDWGVVYILDSSFGHLWRYKKQFPRWFNEAVKVVVEG
jgi:Rad3-related DNA helicase